MNETLPSIWRELYRTALGATSNVVSITVDSDPHSGAFARYLFDHASEPRQGKLGSDVTPRPDTRYSLSKAFGESLGVLYAYKYGAEVMSIRIGNVDHRPADVRRLSIWVSPGDLYQLIRIGLEANGIKHEIVLLDKRGEVLPHVLPLAPSVLPQGSAHAH